MLIRNIMMALSSYGLAFACLFAQDMAMLYPSENYDINLDTAVYRTLTQSTTLKIANYESQATHYKVKQARLFPNPIFSSELEHFGGSGEWKGWEHREEQYNLTQLFETAGKRHLRTQAATYQFYAALVGYDVSKLILLNRLNHAFINVAAAQEFLKVDQEQAEIAKTILHIATTKVEAGKVSLIQANKAEVAYSSALIEMDKAKSHHINAKKRLSLIWSEVTPDFDRVNFPFFEITAPLPLEHYLVNICNQAEIVQSLYYYLNAEKNWRLEKANSVPDITLEVGYKINRQDKNTGMIAGISFPIPLFNRNQGNIGHAYLEMIKTGAQGKKLWKLLQSKLAISYEELLQTYAEAERIKTISLPLATQAFELAQKGYQEGKFEYLDVLDAQRTLFDLRKTYIQTLVNYHTRRADIDYLNSQTD